MSGYGQDNQEENGVGIGFMINLFLLCKHENKVKVISKILYGRYNSKSKQSVLKSD